MSFWFRDVISEGNFLKLTLPFNYLNVSKAIHKDEIKIVLNNNINLFNIPEEELGY